MIQVLQQKDFLEVKVQACLIRVQKRLFRCGMFSHVSEVFDGRQDVLFELGAAGCEDVHKKLQLHYQGVTIGDLKPNRTTKTPDITLAGKLTTDGTCEGVPSLVHNGRTYEKVVVTAILQITLTDYYATVDISNNKIALRSGLQCPFTAGLCVDFEIGETSWAPVLPDKCSLHYFDVLYDGMSSLIS